MQSQADVFLRHVVLQFGNEQSRKRNQVCPAWHSLCARCCQIREEHEICSVHLAGLSPQFLPLKFNCICSQAPLFTLQNQIGLLSNCLFCWIMLQSPFYPNTFLFNDCVQTFWGGGLVYICRAVPGSHSDSHRVTKPRAEDTYQTLSSFSSWKRV